MRTLAVVLVLAACGGGPSPARPVATSSSVPAREPLWIGWRMDHPDHPLVRACGSGTGDPVPQIGAAGCYRGGASGPLKMTDNGFLGSTEADDRVPGGGCTVSYRGGELAPMVTEFGGRVLDEWSPDPDDRIARTDTRVSFSPDGRWIAVVHYVRRPYGDGPRWDVEGVRIAPVAASPCETALSSS